MPSDSLTTALLANAASTPIWGKLADLFNKKVLVQTAILIFVAGSMIAGFAHNVPILLAARVVQGIGMGGLTALVIAIIGRTIYSLGNRRFRGRYPSKIGTTVLEMRRERIGSRNATDSWKGCRIRREGAKERQERMRWVREPGRLPEASRNGGRLRRDKTWNAF